jgi:cytochrome P450
MIHNFLNISKATEYVTYQDLENKQMLFELLTQPEMFLSSLRRYAMSLTTSITHGIRTSSLDDPRLSQLFEVLDALTELTQSNGAALLEVFPLLRRLPDAFLPVMRRSKAAHPKEIALFGGLFREIKDKIRAGTAKPCLGVDIAKEHEKEGISEDVAAYTAGSVLEAGADTTSNTLYAFIQAMVLHPGVQKKIQEEVDQVVGSDRLPNMDDYSRLPYIRGAVKESTRWFSTAILGFPHAVMEDDIYMGYRIPKGAGIFCNVYTIHNDETRFPDPRRFDPDRFKDDQGDLFFTATSPEHRGTWGFGAGRRSCQGLHIAERSLFLAMSRILWAFDIVQAKDEEGRDIVPDPSKVTQGFVCMPEPYKATIRPRSAEKAALIRKYWEEAQADLDPVTKEWR